MVAWVTSWPCRASRRWSCSCVETSLPSSRSVMARCRSFMRSPLSQPRSTRARHRARSRPGRTPAWGSCRRRRGRRRSARAPGRPRCARITAPEPSSTPGTSDRNDQLAGAERAGDGGRGVVGVHVQPRCHRAHDRRHPGLEHVGDPVGARPKLTRPPGPAGCRSPGCRGARRGRSRPGRRPPRAPTPAPRSGGSAPARRPPARRRRSPAGRPRTAARCPRRGSARRSAARRRARPPPAGRPRPARRTFAPTSFAAPPALTTVITSSAPS